MSLCLNKSLSHSQHSVLISIFGCESFPFADQLEINQFVVDTQSHVQSKIDLKSYYTSMQWTEWLQIAIDKLFELNMTNWE